MGGDWGKVTMNHSLCECVCKEREKERERESCATLRTAAEFAQRIVRRARYADLG